eukprot:14734005-Ditylum_brightwellii.AAC.1
MALGQLAHDFGQAVTEELLLFLLGAAVDLVLVKRFGWYIWRYVTVCSDMLRRKLRVLSIIRIGHGFCANVTRLLQLPKG